ncbi:MAG: spermidine synthase [Sulfurimonadaceae bacterium]|jgi:spermidine synthase|nr:spermidine synthase [Sulfurimonadaceae bacterium]
MKPFIYSEMMTHVPLCTHKDPKEILLISSDPSAFVSEVQKHQEMHTHTIAPTLEALRGCADASIDVIICEFSCDAAMLAHINRILKEDGLLVTKHPSLEDSEANKNLLQILGNYFKIIMPYHISGDATALLASKSYHPTADVILHRLDMLDDLKHYNCDIHPAAFAMGNSIRKQYLGLFKN